MHMDKQEMDRLMAQAATVPNIGAPPLMPCVIATLPTGQQFSVPQVFVMGMNEAVIQQIAGLTAALVIRNLQTQGQPDPEKPSQPREIPVESEVPTQEEVKDELSSEVDSE